MNVFRNPCRWALLPLAILVFLAIAAGPTLAAPPLTPEQERGKIIYFTGKSPAGRPIAAFFGEEAIEISGEFATCGSCHGYDGLGRPESGVIPTNITWKSMTKAYGCIHPNGFEHPPFTEESLKHYMITGVYPGGRLGDPSMPTYDMADEDLNDLIGYMKLIGTLNDPGVSENRVRIGTVLPLAGPRAPLGQAMKDILNAHFQAINSRGGIYGRTLELVVHPLSPDTPATRDDFTAWLDQTEPFALVGTFSPGLDQPLQQAVVAEKVPLVGPFTLFTLDSYAANRQVFTLLSGLREQAQALVKHAHDRLQPIDPKVALVSAAGSDYQLLLADVAGYCRKLGWRVTTQQTMTADEADSVATRLKETGIDLVVFLGDESLARPLLQAAAKEQWTPAVLIPGILAGSLVLDAPAGFHQRLFLSYPTMAGDRQRWAIDEISTVMHQTSLEPTQVQATIAAFSASKVLVECIRQAGRDLDRRKLVKALENLYEFDTGLTPKLTFTSNRRIGALGAYVVEFTTGESADSDKQVAATWVGLDK